MANKNVRSHITLGKEEILLFIIKMVNSSRQFERIFAIVLIRVNYLKMVLIS